MIKIYDGFNNEHQVSDNFEVPDYLALLPRPKLKENEVAEIVSSKWVVKKDLCGTEIWLKKDSSKSKIMTDIGDILKDYIDLKPESKYCTYVNKNWSFDESFLEYAKLDKRAEINNKRSDVLSGGFEFDGLIFDSNRDSIMYINSSVITAGLADDKNPYNVIWTLKDNSSVELCAQKIFDVQRAMDAHINSTHAKATEFKDKIDAAKTIADVIKIKWQD